MVDKPDSKVKALNSVYRLENGTDLQFIKSRYVLCIMFGSSGACKGTPYPLSFRREIS